MKLIETRKSLEPCTESGWDAVDLLLAEGLTEGDIRKLGELQGSFIFLRQLKKPFFKVEYHDYVIKGVLGDPFFRVAAHKDQIGAVLKSIEQLCDF